MVLAIPTSQIIQARTIKRLKDENKTLHELVKKYKRRALRAEEALVRGPNDPFKAGDKVRIIWTRYRANHLIGAICTITGHRKSDNVYLTDLEDGGRGVFYYGAKNCFELVEAS